MTDTRFALRMRLRGELDMWTGFLREERLKVSESKEHFASFINPSLLA
jgi:hypothetical protein